MGIITIHFAPESRAMNKRFVLTAVTVFFSLLGGFVSFYVARSQVQFASLNFIFFALAALTAGIGLIVDKDENPSSGFGWLSLCGMLALVWAFVSSLASGRFASTLLGNTTSLVGLAALVCFALVVAYAYRARTEVLSVLGYSAPILMALSAAYGLIAQPPVDANGTVLDALHLGFANSSEFGLFFVLLAPFVLMKGYAYVKNERVDRIARYVLVGAAFIATYVNAMRMASVALLAIALYYVACEFIVQRKVRRTLVACVGGLGLVGAVVFLSEALAGKVGSSFLSIRGQLWRMAFAEVSKRPVLGYGADGFFGASATIAKPHNWWGGNALHLTDGTTDPHNFLVLLTVSFGFVGLVLCCALIVLWFIRALRAQAIYEDETRAVKKNKKSSKVQGSEERERGYFSAPFVAGFAGIIMLLTMPTTVNLLPLLALCLGSAVSVSNKEDLSVVGLKVAPAARIAVLGIGLLFVCVMGTNAIARVSLGGVTYLQGPSFEKAFKVNRIFGWDPFIAHELNTAFAYSTSTGTRSASELARMVSLKSQRPTVADPTNPYYRLMYINVLYKAGRNTSPLYSGSASTPDDLRFALLKQASHDFPKQPDIDIELALSAAEAGQPALTRSAVKTVDALGAYGEQIWATPLKSIKEYLKKSNAQSQ